MNATTSLLDVFGLVLVPLLPLTLVACWCVPAWREAVGRVAVWAALPAVWLAFFGGSGTRIELDWLLFGTVLGLNETTRIFLGFTALLWLGAGMYARGYLAGDPSRPRFELFWLATMAGNFGLLLARDVAAFYLFFALMTFAAYGLVVHDRSPEALRAGRVYLVMAVIGEGLVLAGLLMARGGIATPLLPMLADLPGAIATAAHRDLIVACLFFGFGVKAGLPLLHMWLPLAHPVAPIPASAVLSGAMIKAGVLGWISTLPLGITHLPVGGVVVMSLGFVAAFGGALIGVHQRTPKTVLAYSSISQMGLITVAVGAALLSPRLWAALAPVIALFALHHGLAKGTLFLGVGIARHAGGPVRAWLWIMLALPGLALAGVMSSGIVAKLGLKDVFHAAAETPEWWTHLPLLLAATAIGTTALVARYLWLLRSEKQGESAAASVWTGWGLLLMASAFGVWLFAPTAYGGKWPAGIGDILDLVWPVAVGLVLSVAAWRWGRPWPIPSGDVLAWWVRAQYVVSRIGTSSLARVGTLRSRAVSHLAGQVGRAVHVSGRSSRLEHFWRRDAALVFAALVVVFVLLS